MRLSIIATLYQSASYIKEFYNRCTVTAERIAGQDYEIILVNDGSPDNSIEIALDCVNNDEHVKLIDLSRNFGHHKAMMAGLSFAKGDLVFLIDSDLEEEPEWLDIFYQRLVDENADVVFGVQEARRGSLFEQLTGKIFYSSFRLLTGINQPDNIVTARLMRKIYVDSLLLYRETEINIGGLWVSTGFKQLACVIKKHSSSPTTYSISRKISHFVNAVTSFSSKPLVFTFYTGLLTSVSAVFYICWIVFGYISNSPPSGYTSLIASVWLFSGMIIFFLGIQGIYISKIFSETKQRPNVIVKAVHIRKTK